LIWENGVCSVTSLYLCNPVLINNMPVLGAYGANFVSAYLHNRRLHIVLRKIK
jgi:hypothetical protein